jgi:hypothetical protein
MGGYGAMEAGVFQGKTFPRRKDGFLDPRPCRPALSSPQLGFTLWMGKQRGDPGKGKKGKQDACEEDKENRFGHQQGKPQFLAY